MLGNVRIGLVISVLILCGATAVARGQAISAFNLPSQPLAESLKAIDSQTNTNVLVAPELVDGRQAPALKANLNVDEALSRILAGTGINHKFLNERTIVLASAVPPTTSAIAGADDSTEHSAGEQAKEAQDKSFWDKFRVAQADQGKGQGDASVEKHDEQASKKKPVVLEEVVVTGSRIPTRTTEGPQDVKIYTREKIEQSGQATVSDFLNTLPEISTAVGQSTYQTNLGGTTVKLRGLPFGTTLVLINGRRVQTSGTQASGDFFDLSNIPLAAVERIEVIADGSSAVYGSDAIAGVVNIILKQNFDGLEADAKYGGASGTSDSSGSLAWGKHWEQGSVSVIGSYEARSELDTSERAITRSNDYTAFGGPNNNFPTCSPGNVFSVSGSNLPGLNAPYAAVPAGYAGTPSIQEFRATAGKLNQCALLQGVSLIPETHRAGIFAQGNYSRSSYLELFGEAMYSHLRLATNQGYQLLFGEPGFQSFTLGAANPHNPFGTAVGVSGLLTTLPRSTQQADTDFSRVLVGAKGNAFDRWHWELSIWTSEDSTNLTELLGIVDNAAIQNALNSTDPATALNPLVAGPPGPQAQLQSFFSNAYVTYAGRGRGADSFVRGSPVELPSGPVELVGGVEYERDSLTSDEVKLAFARPNTIFSAHRNSYAVFGELRIPILANHGHPETGPVLAVTLADRRDHYSDFGSKSTPQLGAEWRPWDTLLVRATYAEAFKAPSLFTLYTPQTTVPQVVTDPKTGKPDPVTVVQGGNPSLRPASGQSHSFGIVYSSKAISNLQLSITAWNVDESDSVKLLSTQSLLANESLFPGNVIRASSCPNGPPCPITTIFNTYVNFGSIHVAGIDYALNHRYQTRFGELTSALSVSQTYHYTGNLVPGQTPTDRTSIASDDGNWAPRWKGSAALGWRLEAIAMNLDGRYVGRYQDYDSTTREIGNFWLCDANVRYTFGRTVAGSNKRLRNTNIEVGAVNVFNRLPQYSNFGGSFLGYDPTQADIAGRLLYVRLGLQM